LKGELLAANAILTEGLTKYYGDVVGAKDLDLEVPSGEVFGFLGPNGAGKTTTIRLLMGLLRASSGTAEVLGLDSWRDSVAIKSKVGYLPGDARLYRGLTGEEHIRFIASFDGTGEKEARALALRLDLELDRKVSGFSRGMNQKLAIILALMKKPPVLVMDEPTNALDPLMQRQLFEILSERRQEGATILFVSQPAGGRAHRRAGGHYQAGDPGRH
jgi:ABC-2 type transport system ATP-binding protein